MEAFFSSPEMILFGFVFIFLLCSGLTALLQCWFFLHFSGVPSKKRYYLLYLLLYYLLAIIEVQASWPQVPATFLGLAFIYGFNRLCLKQARATSAAISLITITANVLVEGLSAPLINLSSPFLRNTILSTVTDVSITLAGVALTYALFAYLVRRLRLERKQVPSQLLIFFSPLLLIILLLRLVVQTGYTGTINTDSIENGGKFFHLFNDYQVLMLSVLALVCAGVCLAAFQRMTQQLEAEKQSSQLEQQLALQQTYSREATLRYDLTRSFRHDLKNHVVVLKGLLESAQTEQALEYLENFEQVSSRLSFAVCTGNAAVDALLGDKLALAAQSGIVIRCEAELPSGLGIDDFDLCAVLANALDNAIYACTHAEQSQKWIDLRAKCNKGFLLIDLMNGCGGAPKKGGGLGLPNMKAIAEKYGGTIRTDQTDNTYTLTVLLSLE